MFSRQRINYFVIVSLGLLIPVYLKTKSYLMGNLAIESLFTPMILYDFAMGFGLAIVAVVTHDNVVKLLKLQFSQSTNHLKRFLLQFSISAVSSGIAVYGFSWFFYAYVVPEYTPPNDFFLDVLILGMFIPIFVSGIKESLYFYGEWENELLRKQQLEKLNIQAQYNVLKNQINPHFLFNCFNTLTELAHEDKQQTIQFVQQLSQVYRFVLENKDTELVALRSELDILESYMFLVKIRFGDNIQFRLNNEKAGEFRNYTIAPMTLQILLENALKHNTASKDNPLYIDIDFDAYNSLVFRNNLQQKTTTHSTRTGLQNIKNRYQMLADKTIEIAETATEFIVKIPLIRVQPA